MCGLHIIDDKHFLCLTTDLDHLFEIQSELNDAAVNWRNIGIALQLKPDFLQSIDTRYGSDPRACLSWILMEWLMRNYNVEKFGEPTWQWLVEAVGHPAGGANMPLVRKIASKHKTENIPVAGETTRNYKDEASMALARTIARRDEPGGMSTSDFLVT